jgi:hypothetical protein
MKESFPKLPPDKEIFENVAVVLDIKKRVDNINPLFNIF